MEIALVSQPQSSRLVCRDRTRLLVGSLLAAGLLLGGCASTPPAEPSPVGVLVSSYEHEGAVGSGEVFVDFGAGQYGYPHANTSFLVSSLPAQTGVGCESPFYGLFGPRSFVSGPGLNYRAPVVVRYPPRTTSPGPRTTGPAAGGNMPVSQGPRSTVRSGSGAGVSRGSPAARRVEANTRARTRSTPDHQRDRR